MAGETGGRPGEGLVALAPGSMVDGRYRLEGSSEAGGMGTVFRARDERLDRDVAIKVIVPPQDADPQWRSRFNREAIAVARVSHPHVVPVEDVIDGPDNMMYVVTSFVRGSDLNALLSREGSLPTGRVADIISAVASALDAVHRAGVVHRDIKPANILVESRHGPDDRVYLVDFGIAAAADRMSSPARFVGTPDYAAPEQINGDRLDGQADQYSLAAVAFTLLTGAPPFRRADVANTLSAHLFDPPPSATSLRPSLPRETDAILARALAKARHERFSSTGKFAEALRRALSTGRPSTGSQSLIVVRDKTEPAPVEPGGASNNGQDYTGPPLDDRDDVPPEDQNGRDVGIAEFPLARSDQRSSHLRETVLADSQVGATRPPGLPDSSARVARLYRRSLAQAFTDGLGGIFDIFGVIQRQRMGAAAFEDLLAEDARELCRELGLIPLAGNGAKEGTSR